MNGEIMQNYLRLMRLDKPIGILLLLWPTWWALWIAYHGIPELGVLFAFSAGVLLTRSAGCAINDYADRDFDGMVERTAQRPLATGAIKPKSALILTIVLSLIAFLIAWYWLTALTLLWSIPALVIFVSYPFFKRFFPIPQLYLGVAFSFGIPMAFIQASGNLPSVAYLLFAANLFWVLAYDTIYALVDLPDDLEIGIKTSAITFGKNVIPIVMICYVIFWLLLVTVGVTCNFSWVYFVGLVLLLCLIYQVYRQIKAQERSACFKAFLYNNKLGYLVFISIAINYWWS